MISTVRTETKTSENSFCCNDTYSFFELTFYESVIRTSTLNVTCQIIVLLAIPFFGFYYYLMLRCLFGFAVVNCTLSRSFLIFRMVLRSIKYFYFLLYRIMKILSFKRRSTLNDRFLEYL